VGPPCVEALVVREFKKCGCGAVYTVETWRCLPRVGEIIDLRREFPGGDDDGDIPPFELRTCSACGSTIGHVVPYDGGSGYPPDSG
jgi:hypothetical protein